MRIALWRRTRLAATVTVTTATTTTSPRKRAASIELLRNNLDPDLSSADGADPGRFKNLKRSTRTIEHLGCILFFFFSSFSFAHCAFFSILFFCFLSSSFVLFRVLSSFFVVPLVAFVTIACRNHCIKSTHAVLICALSECSIKNSDVTLTYAHLTQISSSH